MNIQRVSVCIVLGMVTTVLGSRNSEAFAAAYDGSNQYYAYVACESEDEVALVRVVAPEEGEATIEVVERIPVGIYDVEIEGPHGLAVSLDGQ